MSKIRINTKYLKQVVGKLNHWCNRHNIPYSTLRNRACRGNKDTVMEKLIRDGVDLNEVLKIDDNL